MIIENCIITFAGVIVVSISFVGGLNELCTNQTMFCSAEGYKPLKIYSSVQTLNWNSVLRNVPGTRCTK